MEQHRTGTRGSATPPSFLRWQVQGTSKGKIQTQNCQPHPQLSPSCSVPSGIPAPLLGKGQIPAPHEPALKMCLAVKTGTVFAGPPQPKLTLNSCLPGPFRSYLAAPARPSSLLLPKSFPLTLLYHRPSQGTKPLPTAPPVLGCGKPAVLLLKTNNLKAFLL